MTPMAHSSARSLDVGSVIAGTYTVEGLIGKGGMGAVFLASHARLPGKKVAIKVLHPDVADSEALARFRREAEIASRLGHPNIVEVHDWNELPDGTPYIVLELLQGEALADRLRGGPLTLDETSAILRQVGSALAAAHREQIVHRDLKPQNIFLIPADDGHGWKAKVLDFGISKIRGSTTVKTQDTAMLGTPQYMAPEQATGRHDAVDGRTDVFALGAVVYEMLAGVPAFSGTTIPEVVFKVVYEETPPLGDKVPGLPPHVVAAVHRALAKQPEDRWPDVVSFVEAVTGSPLVTARRGLIAAPSDGTPTGASTAARVTGGAQRTQEAFDATVGSGDHASAMAASVRASLAAAQTVAGPSLQTGDPPRPIAVAAATTGGSAAATADVVPAPPPKRRTGLIVGLTAIVAAGAAVAVVLAIGGGQRAGNAGPAPAAVTIDAAQVAAVPVDAAEVAAVDAAEVAAVAVDAAAVAVVAVDAGAPKPSKRDAGVSAPPPPPPPPPDDTDPPDDGEDAPIRARLAEANAALSGGDPDEALRIAKKLTNDHPRAQNAWALRARAACALGDREAAAAALRRVSRPAIGRAVRRACKGAGIEL